MFICKNDKYWESEKSGQCKIENNQKLFIGNSFQNLLVFGATFVLYFGLRVGEAETKFGDLEPSCVRTC